jgi:hypothetical protein
MRRLLLLATAAAFGFVPLLLATPAHAGSAHFVHPISVVRDGDDLTVSGKIAGLGNEDQVHVVVTATAACLNPGGQFPDADNKQTVTAEGDFPAQNGKADFSLTLVAAFQPSCSPPMSIVWGDVTVTDETSGITTTVPGTF